MGGQEYGGLVLIDHLHRALEHLIFRPFDIAFDDIGGFGGAGGYLEMNVYKPLMIFNITHSITIMTDGLTNFRKFLIEGAKPNLKKIDEYVERSLMLVTALAPKIGYDAAAKIAKAALKNGTTLKEEAVKSGLVTAAQFDAIVRPEDMIGPRPSTSSG